MTTLQTGRTSPAVRPLADLTVVVPTFNEADNVEELVRRIADSCAGIRTEVLFVDDSTDHTPDVIRRVMGRAPLRVRMIHRVGAHRVGGLSGAVTRGLAAAEGSWVVVMDGDLQHPPEMVPRLYEAGLNGGQDLVVASRYCGDGDASGLSDSWRRTVSSSSTALARAAFPRRVGRHCTDPMTGFFAVRRDAVDLEQLRPKGFKILLEILARHDLRVGELPFTFGERFHGESKASWKQGTAFLAQLAQLRMGRVFSFGLVGLVGLVVNLVAMALLIAVGANYILAAILAAEISIVGNFLLQERYVFADQRDGGRTLSERALHTIAFNNVEALVRLPFLIVLVEAFAMHEILAQGLTIALAFAARYLFVSKVVYQPQPVAESDQTLALGAAA